MKTKIVQTFLEELFLRIQGAKAADALALARLYGNIAWNNPVDIYRADDIENDLHAKVKSLATLVLSRVVSIKNDKILHVLTEGYTSGGHTRVLERLLGASGDLPSQEVVVVDICPREVIAKLNAMGVTVRIVRSIGLQAISELAAIMAEYGDIVMHIHPDDIVSAVSARIARESGTRVALYNHADHCFTYGACAVDVMCEISAFGREISRRYRPDLPSSFVGIPLNISPPVGRIHDGKNTVLSSGPAYKFDLRAGGVFSSIIERVISDLGLPMLLIGPAHLPPDASEELNHFVVQGKLIILPPVGYATYLDHLRNCLCYIDSAPITGGSALPEAALSGVPCAGLENAVMGYSPIDAIRSRSVDDLIERIRRFRDGDEAVETVSRDELANAHAPATVTRKIVASVRLEDRFSMPYAVDEESLDIHYPHKQWESAPDINIHTRAFDFVSIGTRCSVFLSMGQFGLIRRMHPVAALKLFVSSIATRRVRNR